MDMIRQLTKYDVNQRESRILKRKNEQKNLYADDLQTPAIVNGKTNDVVM